MKLINFVNDKPTFYLPHYCILNLTRQLRDTNRHTQAQFAVVKWNAIYTECVGTFNYLTLQDP